MTQKDIESLVTASVNQAIDNHLSVLWADLQRIEDDMMEMTDRLSLLEQTILKVAIRNNS